MASGGFRLGSGRKKSEPTTVIRVPIFLAEHIKGLISRYKQDPEAYQEMFTMGPTAYHRANKKELKKLSNPTKSAVKRKKKRK